MGIKCVLPQNTKTPPQPPPPSFPSFPPKLLLSELDVDEDGEVPLIPGRPFLH